MRTLYDIVLGGFDNLERFMLALAVVFIVLAVATGEDAFGMSALIPAFYAFGREAGRSRNSDAKNQPQTPEGESPA